MRTTPEACRTCLSLPSLIVITGLVLTGAPATPSAQRAAAPGRVPTFKVDPAWPKPLPNHWIVGAVAGVAVDARDHVWITHRPSTLQPNETRSIWQAAPPVLEFDVDGTLLSSWGGPGTGYEWPQLEHGIYVDDKDNVWLGAGGDKDAHILKFTRQGKFLMQIGHQGKGQGSNDTENLGAAAPTWSSTAPRTSSTSPTATSTTASSSSTRRPAPTSGTGAPTATGPTMGGLRGSRREAAGPVQRRGAEREQAEPVRSRTVRPPPQFRIVHAVRISKDGLVYVCDRTNDRLQVFRKDGTFVREKVIAKDTFGSGSVWDVGFSTDPAADVHVSSSTARTSRFTCSTARRSKS